MAQDIKSNVDAWISLAPAARTATVNGTGVDLAGTDAAMAVVTFGTWTDGTHTPKLQESDDNSTFTDVVAGDLQGTFTAVSSGAGGSTVQRQGYLGTKRYLRTVLTVSGATTGALSAAHIVRGQPLSAPLA